MTIKSFGSPLSLTEIQTEFGGTPNLNGYHAGGSYVAAGTTGQFGAIPSGNKTTISIKDFYGSANSQFFTFEVNGAETNWNVFDKVVAAGYNNSGPKAVITINVGGAGVIGATSTAEYAFNTGVGWSKTPTIVLNNYGYITGAGASESGAWGGPAMYLSTYITVNNQGVIQGGGGAGGGGANDIHGGGAGYYFGVGIGDERFGSRTGTLNSGGAFQDDNGKAGNANGGAGGGWVSGVGLSPSTDGWGYGSPGYGGGPGTYHGGGQPGNAIGGSSYITWTAYGTINGAQV